MRDFIAIDFETANPKRVSLRLGYARVDNGQVAESNGYLINPVGGHAPFQSRIHGITSKDTMDKPSFGELFSEVADLFALPLVAQSAFDRQVLNALTEHFRLQLNFRYTDTCAIARQKLPDIKNHKLKTLVKHFGLPKFKHHDAQEDAIACASVFLYLQDYAVAETRACQSDLDASEFRAMIGGILSDDEVDYKEAYELLYWLEDHPEIAMQNKALYSAAKAALEDDDLDQLEARELRRFAIAAWNC